MRVCHNGFSGLGFQKHLIAAFRLAFLFLVACHSGSNLNAAQNMSNQIVGAGSSFVYPAMTRWISDFHKSHADVQIKRDQNLLAELKGENNQASVVLQR